MTFNSRNHPSRRSDDQVRILIRFNGPTGEFLQGLKRIILWVLLLITLSSGGLLLNRTTVEKLTSSPGDFSKSMTWAGIKPTWDVTVLLCPPNPIRGLI